MASVTVANMVCHYNPRVMVLVLVLATVILHRLGVLMVTVEFHGLGNMKPTVMVMVRPGYPT